PRQRQRRQRHEHDLAPRAPRGRHDFVFRLRLVLLVLGLHEMCCLSAKPTFAKGLTPRPDPKLFADARRIFRPRPHVGKRGRFLMILRNAMTCLLGIGSILLVADSCAASPFPGARPLRDRAGGYELTVLVDGVPARTYTHDGETYVLGQLG